MHILSILIAIALVGAGLCFVNTTKHNLLPIKNYLPIDNLKISASANQEDSSIKLIAVGDIMLGRYIETLMQKNGRFYPFENISPLLKDADIQFGNLEGPIINNFVKTNSGVNFSFNPLTVLTLKTANFNLLSLANNHLLDQGQGGLTETKSFLKKADISFAGDPTLIDTAPAYSRTINGRRIGVLAFNATYESFNLELVKELVYKTSKQNDFIIISIHWGEEYQKIASKTQEKIAHELVDNGADLIIGHHPHVVQNVENYKNKIIFYSLGNFIFDQYFSTKTQQGLLIKAVVNNNGATYELVPYSIPKSQPIAMTNDATKKWLTDLAKNSDSNIASQISTGLITAHKSFFEDNSSN